MTLIIAAQNKEGIVACYDTVFHKPQYITGSKLEVIGHGVKVNCLPGGKTILGVAGIRLSKFEQSIKDHFPPYGKAQSHIRARAIEYLIHLHEDEINQKGGASYFLGLADDGGTRMMVYHQNHRKFVDVQGTIRIGLLETTERFENIVFGVEEVETSSLAELLEHVCETIKEKINNFYSEELVRGFGECHLSPQGYSLLNYREQ